MRKKRNKHDREGRRWQGRGKEVGRGDEHERQKKLKKKRGD